MQFLTNPKKFILILLVIQENCQSFCQKIDLFEWKTVMKKKTLRAHEEFRFSDLFA